MPSGRDLVAEWKSQNGISVDRSDWAGPRAAAHSCNTAEEIACWLVTER